MTQIDNILSRFQGVKKTAAGWSACCPAHNDDSPSLSVAFGDNGHVLLHCHAGCNVDAICAAVGLRIADLMPASDSPKTNGKRRIVATYRYCNEAGELLFQVIRYEPKDFRQRRRKPDGGWKWSVKGVRVVPFLLPQLLAKPTSPIFVCEGEQDTIKLTNAGVLATCNAGGAGKWTAEHAEFLRGRSVAILPDNDEVGRKHARQVAWSLLGVAKSIRIVDLPGLPQKGDVSDWLDAGGTREKLIELVKAALEWQPMNADEIASEKAAMNAEEIAEAKEAIDKLAANDSDEKESTADKLVQLALEMYRFGRTEKDEPFAVVQDGPNITLMLRGSGDALRARLAKAFRAKYEKTPNSSALADAMNVLAGESLDADAEPVGLRLAAHEDAIVVDLGDAEGRVVIVRAGGWEVVDRSPVLFRRTALTGKLPVPERGGTLDELRELLNVTEETWPLIVGWLIAAMMPGIPHPVLLLSGLQGTGKSCAARMLVRLVDDSAAPLRSEPRDVEQWQLAASGSWCVAVDNVSHIAPWFSDAICRAATGDGLVKRKLYSDGDLAVLAFRRVVALTSIDAGALRGDLGERLVLADLEPIGEAARKTESEIDVMFTERRTRLLGALLHAVAATLAKLPDVRPGRLPRMADFARVLAASDAAGVTDGALPRYLAQGGRIAAEVVDADPFALALVELIRQRGTWAGTASELLSTLLPDDGAKPLHGWPKRNGVKGNLKRLTPALAAQGIAVAFDREGHSRQRTIKLELVGKTSSASSAPSASPENAGRTADNPTTQSASCPHDRPHKDAAFSDQNSPADDADDPKQPLSNAVLTGDEWGWV